MVVERGSARADEPLAGRFAGGLGLEHAVEFSEGLQAVAGAQVPVGIGALLEEPLRSFARPVYLLGGQDRSKQQEKEERLHWDPEGVSPQRHKGHKEKTRDSTAAKASCTSRAWGAR